ncbi:MAG: hypothetical protein JKY11_07405 [Alphaproteobacteria bacterium]|nr:hypothetical protein [Alphaproteobacteria bacterium]
MHMNHKSQGNVLFLILIAVALFAALSYAVTQSTRGGGNAGDEKTGIHAAQIIQYAGSIATAIQRIQVSGRYTINEVDFQTPGSNNTNCTVDDCRVFNSNRYGVPYVPPKIEWLTPDNGDAYWGEYRAANFPVDGVGITGGAGDSELAWRLAAVKEDICIAINEKLGVTSGGVSPPVAVNGINLFSWYVGGTVGGNILVDAGGLLSGQQTGCYATSGGLYVFYHVLFAR